MKDEIKEKIKAYYMGDDIDKVLDYITNLQEENERLKAREQECIDKYLVESKYRGEIEGKYVLAKYVIDELEKWLEEQHQFIIEIPVYTKDISIEHKTMEICYENVLDKLKELKEGKE